MNQAVTEAEATNYFLVFHGDIPEILMTGVAYRRVGNLRRFRVINCPYCRNPLTEISEDAKVELYRFPARKKVQCHAYPLCPVCRNEVGMILA